MFEWKANPFLLSPSIPPRPRRERRRDSLTWCHEMPRHDRGRVAHRERAVLGSLKRDLQGTWSSYCMCFPDVWNRDEGSVGRLDDAGKEEGPRGWREMLCLISEHSISWTVLSLFSKQWFLVTALQCQPASAILKPLVTGKFLPLRACKVGTKWLHYAGALQYLKCLYNCVVFLIY